MLRHPDRQGGVVDGRGVRRFELTGLTDEFAEFVSTDMSAEYGSNGMASRSRQLRARRQVSRPERTGAISEFVEFELTDLAVGARAPRQGRRAIGFKRSGLAGHPSSCVNQRRAIGDRAR